MARYGSFRLRGEFNPCAAMPDGKCRLHLTYTPNDTSRIQPGERGEFSVGKEKLMHESLKGLRALELRQSSIPGEVLHALRQLAEHYHCTVKFCTRMKRFTANGATKEEAAAADTARWLELDLYGLEHIVDLSTFIEKLKEQFNRFANTYTRS